MPRLPVRLARVQVPARGRDASLYGPGPGPQSGSTALSLKHGWSFNEF